MLNKILSGIAGLVAAGSAILFPTHINTPPVVTPQVQTQNQIQTQTQDKTSPQIQNTKSIAGSYRCWSYNVSGGGGGNCRLFTPIVLKDNNTYSVSSEHGTYQVVGDVITLSESKLRGPGKIIDGNKIRFEYDYKGWHHVVTYLREGISIDNNSKTTEIPVEITLQYDRKDGSLGYINSIVLVPEGQILNKASYKPTAIAVYNGQTKITGSFVKQTNKVRTGSNYTIYTTNGYGSQVVGTLNLKNIKNDSFKITLPITLPQPKTTTPAQAPTQNSQPPTADTANTTESKPLPKCNPSIPTYSQPPCQE